MIEFSKSLLILLRMAENHKAEFSKGRIQKAGISKGRIIQKAEKLIRPKTH